MKFTLIVCTMILGLIAETGTGRFITIFDASFPFMFLTVAFWSWRLDFAQRLTMAVIAGALLDALSLLPFGSYITAMLILTYGVEFLRHLFARADSHFIETTVCVLSVFFLFSFQIAAYEFFMPPSGIRYFHLPLSFLPFLGAAIWALVLPPAIYGVHYLFSATSRR